MTGAESTGAAATARVVHFVVPAGIDDAASVSGGNVFDGHIRDGLRRAGWDVRMSEAHGDASAQAALADVPDGGIVLFDGLVAGRACAAIERAADRVRIVVLAHMVLSSFDEATPTAIEGERRALRAARRVIATSEWTRSELVSRGLVEPGRIDVAIPGARDAPSAIGTRTGGALLCVGVVAPHKGQDVLIEALASLGPSAQWSCTIAGSLAVDPEFVRRVALRVGEAGLSGRITMAGVLATRELDAAYRRTDLLVAPSRTESYGMAIADALRRGIPVVASRVGGIARTVSPGDAALLVPPAQPGALAAALQSWMADPGLRAGMKREAHRAGSTLPRWSDAVDGIAATLTGVS